MVLRTSGESLLKYFKSRENRSEKIMGGVTKDIGISDGR
jgi:hypothetical protein